MGILLFLVLFLIFVFLVMPRFTGGRKTVEVRGLDGSVLGFSEEGVSWFKDGRFRFFRSSEIKRFSVERLENDVYELKIDDGREIITVPVSGRELQKLFTRSDTGYTPAFPWLGTVLGALTGFLVADMIADSVHAAVHEEEKQDIGEQETIEDKVSQDFEENIADYDSDFDYGDFFDGDI
ncbi:hypothetical protein [Phorcysia thermohydrogeniphila]|uniref:Uncharacterized protein n=1 Tax=Phorcysia thermohydrogeniphila TaxID=936138 RepID=A0A4V6NCX9_9BACT|nr:hypothetical protein [Phorcysia thermohydrogeniphila]TCK04686.1 hypothetical protein CLV27_1119 [Phorcysia thermohydrogeniphila]